LMDCVVNMVSLRWVGKWPGYPTPLPEACNIGGVLDANLRIGGLRFCEGLHGESVNYSRIGRARRNCRSWKKAHS
jgi:hypothetical protein